METAGERKYIRTWVSADGKHAHAGISTKPGAGDEEQPYDTDNGRYMSFTVGAGGGISGGSEVRGKVTPPSHGKETPSNPTPAAVIWKHSKEEKGLTPQMRDALESLRKVPEMESVFISSGFREPLAEHDPHAEGRAVDVSRINGVHVDNLDTNDKAKRAAANLEAWARENRDVNQFIGPNGGWNRVGKKLYPITDPKLLNEHKDHYHINVFRK